MVWQISVLLTKNLLLIFCTFSVAISSRKMNLLLLKILINIKKSKENYFSRINIIPKELYIFFF